MNTINKLTIGKEKSIYDPNSEFMRQLEIYKLKSEIKPRKVDMMQSQFAMMADVVEETEKRKLYVPNNGSYK